MKLHIEQWRQQHSFGEQSKFHIAFEGSASSLSLMGENHGFEANAKESLDHTKGVVQFRDANLTATVWTCKLDVAVEQHAE